MIIFGLKNCDTCRKAVKALPDAVFQDVRADGIAQDVLAAALKHFEQALVNTRSTTWRGLSEEERQKDPMELLLAHPALMKRPLIVDGDQMWLGWTKDVQAALISAA